MFRNCSHLRLGTLVCACLGAAALAATAQPLPPTRLSVATDGTQANDFSYLVDISRDGRQVLFISWASNLVPGDTNGTGDVFVRDRDTDRDGVLDEPGAVRTVRVSEGMAGEQSATQNPGAMLSPDGRFVLFGTNGALVASDTNGVGDAYLRDRDADADGIFDEAGAVTLERVSTGTGGVQGDQFSAPARMTDSGRFVLFYTASTTLQPRPVNGLTQLYRKDRQTGVTTLVSSTPDGTPGDRSTFDAAITPDGHLVAVSGVFASLVPDAPGAPRYPWVLRDLEANTFTPIALAAAPPAAEPGLGGERPPGNPRYSVRAFSPDGRLVYLEDLSVIISTGFTTRGGATFEYDVVAGAFTRRIGGIEPPYGALFPPDYPFRDGRSFTIVGGAFSSVGMAQLLDISRYDAVTGRTTPIVSGTFCAGFARAATRTLYYPTCPSPPAPPLLLDTTFGTPLPMPDPVRIGLMDAAGTMTIFATTEATILPGGADTNAVTDVFAVDLASRFDRDADTLDDRWEVAMGLDFTSNAGADGPAGDPDGDGMTNAQEEDAASHPRGSHRQFLAEGADNAFFKTRLAFANPGTTAATAVVRLDGDDGTPTSINVHMPAGAKRTVFVDQVAPSVGSFATVVESSVPIVSDRTMSWGTSVATSEYGAHAERASAGPGTSWFLAEGATGAFSLFYLLQNPGDTAATATIRYLRPSPLPPLDRTYSLPPRARVTIPVNTQSPNLADTDVSAAITATQPILVERAMYRNVGNQPFGAGHASAGVTAAATSWFLAEGATGPFFDLFILLANPNPAEAQVEVRYLLTNGSVLTRSYAVAGESRRTIYVDDEDFGPAGRALADVAVSCAISVTNGVPIVVERSMWFPGPAVTPLFWTEAHNSPGATVTATRWALADGESGGPRDTQTFLLIANTSSTAGRVHVRVLLDRPSATSSAPPPPPIEAIFDVPANSRTTIPMALPPFATAGRRFGVVIASVETAPLAQLVVERAMYWNADGVTWAAGTNLLATPIP